jgi:putative serine protease PepD
VVSIDVSNLPSSGGNTFSIPGFPGFGGNGNSNGQNGGSDVVEGSGSGIVLSSDGLILTNNHVAGQGTLAVTFQNGRTVKAKLVEADPTTDLAVIKAEGVTDAVPITFGRSADLSVGQEVVAIGSPLGLSGTVTSGIISALHRPIQPQEESGNSNGSEVNVIDGIQTDAPINPGNSGGALVDMNGNLVGITSAIATLGGGPFGGQSGSIGLGFAIPADEAKVVAGQLAKDLPVAHALLGVQVTSSPNITQRGALIKAVTAGGPADKAGLKQGDLVIKADDRIIDTSDALVADVRSHQPGDKVTLTYIRGNATQTVDVILGSDANSGRT